MSYMTMEDKPTDPPIVDMAREYAAISARIMQLEEEQRRIVAELRKLRETQSQLAQQIVQIVQTAHGVEASREGRL